jgi:hypothetical protein
MLRLSVADALAAARRVLAMAAAEAAAESIQEPGPA